MGTKISIKITMTESDEEQCMKPRKESDGSFTMSISEADSFSIDKSEKSVLQTAYPAIREALKQFLTEQSKKKPLQNQKVKR
jgi:hypothetical protein